MRAGPWGRAAFAVSLIMVAAGGCLNGELGTPPRHEERFDDARVAIQVGFEQTSSDAGTVVALYEPVTGGIHLYGLELPRNGIDGAGRPTLVTVVDPAWHAVGPLIPSVGSEPVEYPGFDVPFPVYPDGPVTLRQRVERTGADIDGTIETTITFMACTSSGLCYVPIEDHAVSVPSR